MQDHEVRTLIRKHNLKYDTQYMHIHNTILISE
jgi:hypothetical protein